MSDKKPFSVELGLRFFSNTITSVNAKRQKINQTKGIASFVVKKTSWTSNLTQWELPLSVLSFTLYYARLASNLILLARHLNHCSSNNEMNQKMLDLIAFDILNDIVWSTINLVQFFWLTFKVSIKAGLRGVQLEGIGMLFDDLVMLVQFKQKLEQHQEALLTTTSAAKKDYLKLEWEYKQMNVIRSFIHITLFSFVFIGFGLGVIALPLSILVFVTNIMSNGLRIMLGIIKDKQQTSLMRQHEASRLQVNQHLNRTEYNALQQINHFIHFLILTPLSLILCAPGSMVLSVGVMMSVLFSDYVIDHLIERGCEEKSNLIALG
ncbi:MAG: hypothetical protein K0U37_09365 [Gammaproteobacteria bacterium]|nr:hypothetical protein [Gammaproteobacteria bacterium]